MRNWYKIALGAVVATALATAVQARDVGLRSDDLGLVDADVFEFPYQNRDRANYGGSGQLGLAANINDQPNTHRQIFMRFELEPILAHLGPNARVILRLHGERWLGGSGAAFVFAVRAPWVEGDQNHARRGPEQPDFSGGITWINKPPVGTRQIWAEMPLRRRSGKYEADITGLVRAWARGDMANNGLALVLNSGSGPQEAWLFHSSESESRRLRPRILIENAGLPPAPEPEPEPEPNPDVGNLLVNGDFEQGPPGFGLKGDIPGWRIRKGNIDVVRGIWQRGSGQNSVDLAGSTGLGQVLQMVDVTPGAQYRLTFLIAGNPDCDHPTKEMLIGVDRLRKTYTFDTSSTSKRNMGWRQEVVEYTAENSRSIITFLAQGANKGCGMVLDGVRLEKM